MIFSSPIFLFIFLPIVYVFHSLAKREAVKKGVLVLSSLVFYGWWEPTYLILIAASIVVNYLFYLRIVKDTQNSKALAITGIIFNISLLAYFKYSYFIIDNLSYFVDGASIEKLVLPLGISFFTFQQIAFLVDTYKQEVSEYSLLDYSLFVTFFPQLIAGPIVHHKEMMPQFKQHQNPSSNRVLKGLVILSIGMFKKLIIADTFSIWADAGFTNADDLTFFGVWLTTLSYTVQLYYDFSGYCDMAIGLALLFNIKLPVNFNSPYKSINIQEFWRRWHMTLSTWLKDYIYIPLGGNKGGDVNAMFNVLVTFLIGGFWHGAGWNFLVWGGMHGVALAVHRLWGYSKIKLPIYISWFLTMLFVHFAWVFFRAEDISTAMMIVEKMLQLDFVLSGTELFVTNSVNLPFVSALVGAGLMVALLIVVLLCTLVMHNSLEITKYSDDSKVYSTKFVVFYGTVFGLVSLSMFLGSTSSFLYFDF